MISSTIPITFLRPSHDENIQTMTFDESEFGIQEEKGIVEENEVVDNVPGIIRYGLQKINTSSLMTEHNWYTSNPY